MKTSDTDHTSPLTLNQSKELVDTHLLNLFNQRRQQAGRIDKHYQALWDAIIKLYSAGGKRLRPYIVLLSHSAFGGKSTNIIPVASAFELLHQAMLIHDDIIDRDTVRYGIKNLTGQYEDAYRALLVDTAERRHFAESSALLAGDLLISEAHAQLILSNLNPTQLLDAQQILANAVFYVAGGELIDTEASFRLNEIDPMTIATTKTSSYSFIAPLTMGAALAGANDSQISILETIGKDLGIGFQLRDDIIGIFGDETKTGKSSHNDLREGKQTLLIQEFYTLASNEQRTAFQDLFGKKTIDTTMIQKLRYLLMESGALARIEERISHYKEAISQSVESLDISTEYKEVFKNLVEICLFRDK